MTIRKSTTALAAAALIALGGVTLPLPALSQGDAQPRHTAEEISKATPSGTLELEAEQVRLILGGSSGRGTLFYKGKSYPFTMKGGTVGGVGVTKVNATGTVYFLDKVEDFPGMYSAATAGAALGGGVGASQFENNKGVYVAVRSKSEGVALNMGLGAVSISFAK
ncbi:MAG: DUF1134 domain-containing protein [Burkholderiales bacterium]